MKKVYFAGPDIFKKDAEKYFEKIKELCKVYGFKPLIPLDNSNDPEVIHYNCLGMLNECDAIVANVSPFRGPSCDVGTAFEIGYATAMARIKPIEIITYVDGTIYSRTDYFTKIEGLIKDKVLKNDTIIENFGLSDNLMISIPIKNGPFISVELALIELKERYKKDL